MFKGSYSLRTRSLADDRVSFEFELRIGRNPAWHKGAKVDRYVKVPFTVPKELPYRNIKAQAADVARAEALATAELRRRLPHGRTISVAKAQDRRQTLDAFAPTVLTADRRNPNFPLRYVPVGPGTAAGDLATWSNDCAHRIGSWTFRDFEDIDAGLALLNTFRDDLGRPYTAAEREADIARGCRPYRLRKVGQRYERNTITKICSCVRTVLREAADPRRGLVSPALVAGFKYEGTKSTNAGKVDLSTPTLDVFLTCWTFMLRYEGQLPPSRNLAWFSLLWSIGSRPGELMALQWSDIEGLDGTGPIVVKVRRAVQIACKGEKVTVGNVKNNKHETKPDRPPIELPPALRPVLLHWRDYQRTRREHAGIRGDWHVMTNQLGTLELTGKSCPLSGWWNRMKARIVAAQPDGCPTAAALLRSPGLYAFRHSAGAHRLRTLKDPALGAALMGHSIKTFLEAYQPIMDEIRRTEAPAYVTNAIPDNLPMPAAGGGPSDEDRSDPASNVVDFPAKPGGPFSDVA
jgi:integrase